MFFLAFVGWKTYYSDDDLRAAIIRVASKLHTLWEIIVMKLLLIQLLTNVLVVCTTVKINVKRTISF